MKYIFVSGGVISGLGKGIATSSIALLLKSAGYRVTPLKIDPYLNVDAGTMNPIEHGEVFVLDDGSETDQDLGHYERFLTESLNSASFTTSGQVYLSVIQRERSLEYEGACVEAVPHIPEEIIRRINEAGRSNRADVVIIEIGGTVGELQNMFIFEANRLLKLKRPEDVIHVHLSYLPVPSSLGEMKSKPAQMSIKELNSLGIQPDILLARSSQALDSSRRKKLSLFGSLEMEDIISAPDVPSIYDVPLLYAEQNLTERILKKLGLKRQQNDLKDWKKFVDKMNFAKKVVKIGIVGKYFTTGDFTLSDSYISVIEAIKHASYAQGLKPEITWIDAGKLQEKPEQLEKFDGVIVPGGFGERDIEGKIAAIKYVRENNIPYLGLCYGMQLALVEIARNVLGYKDAHTTEISQKTKYPIIHIMPDQEKKLLERNYGGTMRLGAWECVLKQGTAIRKLYGKDKIWERHRHRYEVNNAYVKDLEKAGVVFSGTSQDGKIMEIMELPSHPYFTGSQFHPELKSRPLDPHPMFLGFISAAAKQQT
ncbi:CTP synthase [Candidatus Daviesbacteria bacterium]|nr:CTP synthase [Candidatus Daviesbacteria bacterium]